MIELFSFDFRNGGPRLLAAGFRSLAFLFFSTNRKRRLLWNVTFFFVLHSVDQSMMNIMRKKGKRALFFTKKELFNGSRSDLGDRWNMSALPDFCCGSFFLFVVEAFHFHCVYWSPLFICVLFFFWKFQNACYHDGRKRSERRRKAAPSGPNARPLWCPIGGKF